MKAKIPVSPYNDLPGMCPTHSMMGSPTNMGDDVVWACYKDPMNPHFWKEIEI